MEAKGTDRPNFLHHSWLMNEFIMKLPGAKLGLGSEPSISIGRPTTPALFRLAFLQSYG